MKRLLVFVPITVIVAIVILSDGPERSNATAPAGTPAAGYFVQIPLALVYSYSVPTTTPVPTWTPVPTAMPTATTSPTATPTLTPVACNGSVQALANPSFEGGLSPWLIQGVVFRTSVNSSDGVWSVSMAGYNNAVDGLQQFVIVPGWAETGRLYFSELMYSSDSYTKQYDALSVTVYDAASKADLAVLWLWNTEQRGSWVNWRSPVLDLIPWRGRQLGVLFAAFTDVAFSTGWYVDNVRLYFGCGGAPLGSEDTAVPAGGASPAYAQMLNDMKH